MWKIIIPGVQPALEFSYIKWNYEVGKYVKVVPNTNSQMAVKWLIV